MLRFGAIFSAFPFTAPAYPTRSLRTLPPASCCSISPAPPFHKEVNKKLSYRKQNAFSVVKTHERNTYRANIYCIYPYATLDWLYRRIMFSNCRFVRPSVRLFVRSFVCYQLMNAILQKRMNRVQCKLTEIFLGARAWRATSGTRRSKVKVTRVYSQRIVCAADAQSVGDS